MVAGLPGSHGSQTWDMGVAKAKGDRTGWERHAGGVSEQMLWAGAAAEDMPRRSSCRAKHQDWERKERSLSPNCSTGCAMSSSRHELTALWMATGWQQGQGSIRDAHLGTGIPVFAVTPKAGSESQAVGTCVAASLSRDAAKPRGVKILMLQQPGTLQSACLLPQLCLYCSGTPCPAWGSWATSPSPNNTPAATSGSAQAKFCPACSAGAMSALGRLSTSVRSCPDKSVPPLPLSPGLGFLGTMKSTSPSSKSLQLPSTSLFWGPSREPRFSVTSYSLLPARLPQKRFQAPIPKGGQASHAWFCYQAVSSHQGGGAVGQWL